MLKPWNRRRPARRPPHPIFTHGCARHALDLRNFRILEDICIFLLTGNVLKEMEEIISRRGRSCLEPHLTRNCTFFRPESSRTGGAGALCTLSEA